jgi:predicted ATP-grasp superfamily ATP-dependent carboligase
MEKRVLVLGGEQWKTLSIVRSLGKKDIDVDVVSKHKLALCFYSKYCKRKYILSEKSWLKKLLKILKIIKYDLIIPAGEEESIVLSKIKNLPVVLPPAKSLEIVANKILTIKLMKKIGIPLPKTYIVKNLKDLDKIKERIRYPVIIRPSYFKYHSRPRYIFSKENFLEEYLQYHKKSPFPFVQEVVIGDTYGFFALCKNGKILQYFAHKRIIEQDPKGAGSAVCVSSSIHPKMKKYSEKILKKLKWNGVAMIEYKKDEKDGEFKLIEINGRFWGSLPLAIYAGVDFPYQLYCLAVGEKFKKVRKWRRVCAGHLLGIMIYLFRVLKGKPKDWSLYYPNFWEAIKKIASLRNCKPYVFDFQDPLPFFIEFLYKIASVIF